MGGRTLAVLMWKHLMVRKRRYIHTTVEICTPLVFFFILFQFRSGFQSIKPSNVSSVYDYKVQIPDTIPLSKINVPRKIFYYPQNALTDELMDEVGRKLELSRLKFMPSSSSKYKGYYGVRNLTEISSYMKDMRTNEAFIAFENINEDEWPSQLIYSIRMKGFFLTNSYQPLDQMSRPHRQYGEVYEEFVRLQWIIDTSYIKVVTGTTVSQEPYLQEFPYYGNFVRASVVVLCTICFFLSFLSLIITFVFQMQRLLEEKATGIQELIRMVGVSTNTLAISHFLNVLPVGIIYSVVATVLMKTTSAALFPYSDGFLMFLMFLLHFISVLAMAFACSYLVRSTQYVTSISVFAYITLLLPCRLIMQLNPPRAVALLCGLLPHQPMSWYWAEIQAFEYYGEGLGWSGVWSSHTEKSGPIILGLLFLIIQSLVFFFLAWYLSKVAPGKYGIAQPWNFLFQRQYWTKNEVNPGLITDEEDLVVRDERYFEPPPSHLPVGVHVDNVSKTFPKHKALSNVNLDVYKGEITVLLGHNGAGKTTLMSIITGMLSQSEGTVFVNGKDITRNRDKVSKEIGLCPQHNLFFPDLTVLEHVMFFTLLKSGNWKTVRTSSHELLDRLGLGNKADSRASQLSGGMQRRLQLAIALAGDADILILDEPTAGLDVETRRELWDLLLSLRGSRAVLLSTHFMEEADALGDRVAALHAGRLRCYATTMHLKKAIGTGYRLHLTTRSVPRDGAITAVVTSQVAKATLLHKSINTLTYNLPAVTSNKFPKLFAAIEHKKAQLEIESIGVGVSTLEEVFLQLCSDTDFSKLEDQVDGTLQEPTFKKVTGTKLFIRQFCILLKRQWNFLMSKKMSFAILQVIMPVVALFVVTHITNNQKDGNENINAKLKENLDMYRPRSDAKVMYNINNTEVIGLLKRDYPYVDFVGTKNNIEQEILRISKEDAMEYNKYLIGIELNNTVAKLLYTTVVRHAAGVGMNLLTNIISSINIGGDSTNHIITYNHPIPTTGTVLIDAGLKEPKGDENIILWTIFLVFVTLASAANLAALPCRERVSGSRHIHLLSGCPAVVHWAATLAAHAALAALTLVLPAALAAATLDRDTTIDAPGFIGCMILVLILGMLAFLAFVYVVSFVFAERGTGVLLIAVIVIFGLITPLVSMTLDTKIVEGDFTAIKFFMGVCLWLTSPHAMFLSLRRAVNVAKLNAYCTLNVQRCPKLIIAEKGFDSAACCAGKLPRCYLCWDDYSPAPYMLPLVLQFFLYMAIVLMTQEGVLCRLKERIVGWSYKPPPLKEEDDAVNAEREFVEKIDKNNLEDSGTAMLVQNLHKNYVGVLKNCNAVKGINFSVAKGECFGLLGVNGAGKSTTFKMITSEECPTRGTVYANGYHLHKDRIKYMRTLGYCPQFFGLDTFQTGRANLELLMTLRGLSSKDVQSEVETWLGIVGLEKFGGRAVSGYSGGMCRRLGAAAALCAGRAALLDEPTAGVDVAARRRVWAALRVRLLARPVLLSSHSMDEMEALCHRVAIMAGGRVRAIGSPHELRAHHAHGHALTLKLRNVASADEVDSRSKNAVNNLKDKLGYKFNCTLKDEHRTMLHYHINENVQYSTLFSELEALKNEFPDLLEDYSVTETTLEEVFLAFAREQQEEGQRAWGKKKKHQNNIV